jgi:hypothetical protein
MNLQFTGIWIPKEVLENSTLSLTEKLCLSLIDSLDGDDGCFASNIYIANMANIEKRQLQNILNKLIERKLVIRTYTPIGRRILRTVHSNALRDALHCTPPVHPIAPPQCNELHPYNKEDNKEDIDTKIQPVKGMEATPVMPYDSKAFSDAWMAWIAYRKETKKKLVNSTVVKQFDFLKSMKDEARAIQSINQSIEKGWAGLFAVTENKFTNKPIITKQDHRNGF